MPTCGNCAKSVGSNDVTCPHCGVLLAAYASPEGSGAAGTYQEPEPPPVTEIPAVDMEVKPPSEKEVVTDPAKVTEEPISTAPQPLFDTYLTVEEIARAAEGDHADDVITITNKKVATKKVEFEIPDYAKPPVDAAPLPTIDVEADEDSIPLITRDYAAEDVAPSDPQSDDDDSDSESGNDPASESWLYLRSQPEAAPRPQLPVEPEPKPQPKPEPEARPDTRSAPKTSSRSTGRTEDYIRELHAEAGYTPESSAVSRPVDEGRIPPAERRRNRQKAFSVSVDQQEAAESQSTSVGCSTMYVLVLAILWFSTIVSIVGGNISPMLIFVTAAATWGFGPVRKFIRDMQSA